MTIDAAYRDVLNRILSTSGKRYLVLTGGRGSGKSFICNNLIIRRLLKDNAEVMLMTRYTLAGVRNGLLPSIKSIALNYPQLAITNTSCRYLRSSIIFDGIKSASPSKLKSIDNLSLFICDEASDIPTEFEFDTIDQSIRASDKDALVILILNPTNPDHWIYKRFYRDITYNTITINNKNFYVPIINDKNVIHIHTTFLNNLQNLSQSFINIAKNSLNENEVKFANQFLGIWTDFKGSKIFNTKKGELDRSLPCAIGVDFGYYPDPTTIVKVYIDVGNKVIYAEELLYEHNMSADMLRNELLRYTDYDIIADINAKTVTEPLKMQGLSIYYKSMKVELYQQLLLLSDYQVIVSGENLYNELITYRWDKNKPIAGYGDHAIDAMRYAAFALIKKYS